MLSLSAQWYKQQGFHLSGAIQNYISNVKAFLCTNSIPGPYEPKITNPSAMITTSFLFWMDRQTHPQIYVYRYWGLFAMGYCHGIMNVYDKE